jgi:hypothetical protein
LGKNTQQFVERFEERHGMGKPVTEDEMGALREEMDAGREEVREALTEDLGGAPEDYDAGTVPERPRRRTRRRRRGLILSAVTV